MDILIDMDGVIADFEKHALAKFRELYPSAPFIPLEKRATFHVVDQYPEEWKKQMRDIHISKNFFLDLPPIEGAFDALNHMQKNHNIYICTSPILDNPYCASEKYQWVHKHLGKDWAERTIVMKDKTLVNADFLIDDRPEFNNSIAAMWEHILYTQPYNMHVTSKRRLTWKTYRSVLGI